MLETIPEVYIGTTEDPEKDFRYWSYLIFKNLSDSNSEFDLLRIDNVMDTMEVLGRDIPHPMCLNIIAKWEPDGFKAVQQSNPH